MALSRLSSLFSGKAVAPPTLPAGLRVYAIGDIHGRSDLLNYLAQRIEEDKASAGGLAITVFLGDYIDRGPDSAGVIDRLARRDFPTEFVALRGNHEEVLLKFLTDPDVLSNWRNFGGLETLHSYGVDVQPAMRGTGFDNVRRSLIERMPASHRRFLIETTLSASFGDYFFCHAGARPGVPLEQQTPRDLLWIRGEFLEFRGSWDKVVVHGHTPVAEPELLRNRINVDTGAFASSVLTAVVLDGSSQRLLIADGRSLRHLRGGQPEERKRSA
jgi:serine/threonine protein phosphatase 1